MPLLLARLLELLGAEGPADMAHAVHLRHRYPCCRERAAAVRRCIVHGGSKSTIWQAQSQGRRKPCSFEVADLGVSMPEADLEESMTLLAKLPPPRAARLTCAGPAPCIMYACATRKARLEHRTRVRSEGSTEKSGAARPTLPTSSLDLVDPFVLHKN